VGLALVMAKDTMVSVCLIEIEYELKIAFRLLLKSLGSISKPS
jgi:hypothetical protein